MDEAVAYVNLINAQHSISYQMAPEKLFLQRAECTILVPDQLLIPAGEEINLE